jgi:sucrose-6-phosphate hydrolase SacC (GH32 family)
MWGWLQERRKAGSYDYSGCMTCSRLLYISDNRLIQLPVPELRELRSGRAWAAKGLEVNCREPYPLEGVTSPALDIELILQRCAATCWACFAACTPEC